MRDRIGPIREFNRVVTRRVGALDSSFLGCGVSLGKARLLFEIAHGIVEVQRLRTRLRLDPAQMSRMLRSLERQSLIETSVHPADARARILKLTPAGKAKLRMLERKADEGALSWLAPLSDRLRTELLEAMAAVVRILQASEITIRPEDPRSDAAKGCLDELFRELDARFEKGFDPDLASSANPEEVEPPAGCFLIARSLDQPVGCAGLKRGNPATTGEVKRMWVSPQARGLGVGRRLLESVEFHARRMGLKRLRLSTHRALTEAQGLYRASGYREIPRFDDEPYAHLAFGKRLK